MHDFPIALALCLLLLIHSSFNTTDGIIVKDDVPPSSQGHGDSPSRDAGRERANVENNNPQNFHEVDAFGDDYVDFGAHTGINGAFYWHANFPIEENKRGHYQAYDYDRK